MHRTGKRSTQNLHTVIGDYFREIDKIKRNEKLAEKTRVSRILAWRNKIRQVTLTLQKMKW